MAEKFVDLFELLRSRLDLKWVKAASFGPNFFINIGSVYAAYAAAQTENTEGPTIQIRSAAGNFAFVTNSYEDATVAAKIVVDAAQVTLDAAVEDQENVLKRYIEHAEKTFTKETENADG